ncbi:MAG: transporter substrate-binding domain-containing protein, partial [Flavobacteriaceae bacterium]|nr:transporter substrate-binding domain-containing protein [Flavobacteriaceae bacterium]
MNNRCKLILNFLLLFFLLFVDSQIVAQDSNIEFTPEEKSWISSHPVISVGNERYWPPIDFVKDGKPMGYAIDLMDLIGKELGIKINYISGLSWAELMEALKNGSIDVLPAISKTDERATYIKFSKPYINLPYVKVINSTKSASNDFNFDNKTLAVIEGSYIATAILEVYPDIDILSINTMLEGLQKVSTGEADVFIENLGLISYYMGESYIPNIKLVSGDLGFLESSTVQIGVLKKNKILGDLIDKGLGAISKEDVNELRKKWIPNASVNQMEDLLTSKELQWISNQAPMKVANAMDWPPFNFSDKGRPKGYSIELIQLVSEKIGLPLEFVSGNTWEEIVEKFKIGELDILPSVYLTESRKEFITFTESYASNPSVLVVNAQNTNIKTLKDLSFKKVAVISNYATAEVLDERFPNIQQVYVKNAAEGLNAVSVGNVEAFIESIGPVSYLIDKNFIPNVKIIGNIEVKRTEETELHFGVAKNRLILRDILQKGLDALSVEELKTIRQKWIPTGIAPIQKEGIFKASDIWKVIIIAIILFVIFYFGFKWVFNRFIKEDIALEFGSRKFRVKTNFYLSILVIAVASLGWLAINYIEGKFVQNLKLQLENDLNSANGRLEFWLKERKDYLKSLGHDQKLIDLTNKLKKVSKYHNKDQYNIIHNKLAEFFEEHHYQGSYIIDEEGFNIGSVDTSFVGDLNNVVKNQPELLKKVFKGEVVFVPPILLDGNLETISRENSSLMYFLIPIENIEHQVIAAIIQEIDPAYGFSEILQLSHVGETGESYIFNREGRMLSTSRFESDLKTLGVYQLNRSGRSYIEIRDPEGNLTTGYIPKKSFKEQPLTLMAKSATEGNNDVNVDGYNDYRGVLVMGAWMWIDNLELGLATEIDVEEALSLFYFIRLSAIIVLGITLIFIIGSILFTLSLGEKANVALIK